MGEYLKKGSKCYVEGKLRTDEFEKDGIKRYSTKIIANEMTMLDSRNSQGDNMAGGYNAPAQPAAAMGQAPQHAAPQAAPAAPYGQPQHAAPQQQAPQQPAYGQAPQQTPAAPYGQPQQAAPQHQAPAQQPQPSNAFDDFDDDIPF